MKTKVTIITFCLFVNSYKQYQLFIFQFNEGCFTLRTRAIHDCHVSSLNGPLASHSATTYGVMFNSVLNSSRFFHVVDGLVPDIMHDILEGGLQLHIKWLLRHFIQDDKYFSLATLNTRIECFCYGSSDSQNKPSPLNAETISSAKSSVKQSCK